MTNKGKTLQELMLELTSLFMKCTHVNNKINALRQGCRNPSSEACQRLRELKFERVRLKDEIEFLNRKVKQQEELISEDDAKHIPSTNSSPKLERATRKRTPRQSYL
jgi:uncharacterized protein YdcH (DUF465 family)